MPVDFVHPRNFGRRPHFQRPAVLEHKHHTRCLSRSGRRTNRYRKLLDRLRVADLKPHLSHYIKE